ncbi:MAG: hypothetical protein JXR51_07265 [Bacteroidales bacterium]|nr:hypothetical protein [Bacteroidales bacterium]MBN2756962.1 hypothetical protein [Bacteroidales bacterium]
MKNSNIKSFILLIFLFSQISLFAQDFVWQAKVGLVSQNSYQKINLNPSIISKMENGFDDIRIYDSKNIEVPYILESENLVNKSDYFIEYEIVSKENINKWPYYTRLIIHNPYKNNITKFYLVIKNSDVTKSLKLSGSDDKSNWYIIKDNYQFQSVYSNQNTSEIEIMNFPKSNYEYFEILIDDWKNNPINILKAGYFDSSYEEGKFSKIEAPIIIQEELSADKQSLVKIQYAYNQLINKLSVDIPTSDFYFRKAEIQIKDSIIYKKKKPEIYYRTIKEITLSSNSSNTFYLDNFKTKEFYLRIYNKDNKALKIDSVNAYQLNNYLICKLEKRGSYILKFGDKNTPKAEYDLAYFINDIPTDIPNIDCSNVEKISSAIMQKEAGVKISKTYIWLAIFLVISFLAYMTFKMLKDMKKEQKE